MIRNPAPPFAGPALTRRALLGAGLSLAGSALLPGAAWAQEAPRRGGRIRVASIAASTADTLDPAKGGLSTDYVRHYMTYSGLTAYAPDLTPRPALAESLDSDDQMLWRVALRRGVQFHDGKELTSADVVFSLLRHKDPATASKMKVLAGQIAEVQATGTHEVMIRLTGPNADLPAILAQSHFLIVQDGTKDFSRGIGTGAFRIKTFEPGVRTVSVRNENYWKPGKGHLDEIELIAIPDEVSRVNALLSGDVQLVMAVNPRSVRRIRSSPAHALLETRSSLYTNLVMRRDGLPTGNPDFVLAMKHLLDRDLIRRAMFRNYATIANDHPIPPWHPYFREDLPQRTFDLDRAKFHLQRAGLTGIRLPVYASPAAEGSVDMASVLQEYGARVGLKLAVNRMPSDGYWSTHWMKHPLTFGNTNPRPTADLIFSLFFKSDAPWNESGWQNERFDRLLMEARGEADQARRKQLYGEMQGIVHEECGIGIPVFITLIDGHDVRLKGLEPVALGGFMGYAFAEHVWWDA
ncbi:MAG TPA: ABC transporter substrate-binding protein [Azospirillaceae bacterium]|nr:ABC transporter substrate-binding protein [Azospirillaceae bacterium]